VLPLWGGADDYDYRVNRLDASVARLVALCTADLRASTERHTRLHRIECAAALFVMKCSTLACDGVCYFYFSLVMYN